MNSRRLMIQNNKCSMILGMMLCLLWCFLPLKSYADGTKKPTEKPGDRVFLIHADELRYDQFGPVPDAQIVKGRVQFQHNGATLWCDSAYFYQQSNSVKAFGHVRYVQGKGLSMTAERAAYDGMRQLLQARKNVVLRHGRQTLYTDSLDYDRFNDYAYFFEGGRLVDGKDRLVSDWGDYT